ncbi:hypothetical protein Y027_4986 [Burkholderia pseudomallei TSV5]|nr:hypothetical protein X948_4969 [Burkholderia pseudomallei MSHR5608]KGX52137.1 hypothetical protein Y027_4986 [Burkholderia pseudomallei TSV5]KGX52501.1 hypothetical protein Y025_4862 [Burkholderia pseudomallei TSV32]
MYCHCVLTRPPRCLEVRFFLISKRWMGNQQLVFQQMMKNSKMLCKLTLLEFHGQRNRPLQASIIGKRRFQPMRSLFI